MEVNVINSSRELTRKETYVLATAQTTGFKDAVGAEIVPDIWMIYEDVDKDSVVREILVIKDKNGEFYGGNSPTFIENFLDAVMFLGADFAGVVVLSGISKSGKSYVTCRALI